MKKLPEGTIRVHSGTKHIKHGHHPLSTTRGWIPYHRYIYHLFEAQQQTTCNRCQHEIHWWDDRPKATVAIIFKDKNQQNTDFNNLEAVCLWCSSFISTSPYTQPEHQQALETYGHLPPDQRPSKTHILIEEWGIPVNDILYNLEQHRQPLEPATHVN